MDQDEESLSRCEGFGQETTGGNYRIPVLACGNAGGIREGGLPRVSAPRPKVEVCRTRLIWVGGTPLLPS